MLRAHKVPRLSAIPPVFPAGQGIPEATVSTEMLSLQWDPRSVDVLSDGARVYASDSDGIFQTRATDDSGWQSSMLVTNNGRHSGAHATAMSSVCCATADPGGNVIFLDRNSVKRVLRDGVVEKVAGVDCTSGYTDGPALAARFRRPGFVCVTTDVAFVVDTGNHAVRVIEHYYDEHDKRRIVRTLAGGNKAGFADGVGRNACFKDPMGAALALDHSFLLVADTGNNALRRISLRPADYGVVTTLSGGPTRTGMLDGPLADARWNYPCAVVVAGGGQVVVADRDNFRLRMVVGANVVTLAGSGQCCVVDGRGQRASFVNPSFLAMDQHGRVLVVGDKVKCTALGYGTRGVLRVVDAGLAPRIGGELTSEPASRLEKLGMDVASLLGDRTFADVVLKVSDCSFHAHRAILVARSLFFSRMFSFGVERAAEVVELQDTSSEAVALVLRYMYTGLCADTDLSHEHLLDQIVLADRWDVAELMEHLLVVLERKLDPSNACEMLAWAFNGRPVAVQNVVVQFFSANSRAIKVHAVLVRVRVLVTLRQSPRTDGCLAGADV